MSKRKQTLLVLAVLLLMLVSCETTPAFAARYEPTLLAEYSVPDFDPNVDYLEEMILACMLGDESDGRWAAAARDLKIESFHLHYTQISFEDLYLLSKIMYAEAGSYWLSDEWKMCVGEVVLNRVASPEFPDTIREVLEQPGQYYGKNCRYFDTLQPSELCVRLAVRLLEGERVMDDLSVVFQANFPQGSGTHTLYYDKLLGGTWFCFSNYPDLYERNA